jgi:Fe-S cluster assembly iron-binding protein IscA
MGMALDEPQENDQVEELNGIRVSIDERIVSYTEELTVDFQKTEQGAGLVFLGQEDCC